MYNSKYYTCEQIDQRLLDGYYDDAVAAGYTGTKAQYLAGLLKAINYSANPTLVAEKVIYNPSASGLSSKSVKAALDELSEELTHAVFLGNKDTSHPVPQPEGTRADIATKAIQDDEGNSIKETYATNENLGITKYPHFSITNKYSKGTIVYFNEDRKLYRFNVDHEPGIWDTSQVTKINYLEANIIQGGVYDVSTHNNDAVFESLQALLSSSNLSTLIPISVRHGGMSIKFIQGSEQSSDNKYVQYRLMANTFSTTVANWQGVDNEPTIGSNNLVKSGGVANSIEGALYEDLNGKTSKNLIDSNTVWTDGCYVNSLSGRLEQLGSLSVTEPIQIQGGTKVIFYSYSADILSVGMALAIYDSSSKVLYDTESIPYFYTLQHISGYVYSVELPQNAAYVRINVKTSEKSLAFINLIYNSDTKLALPWLLLQSDQFPQTLPNKIFSDIFIFSSENYIVQNYTEGGFISVPGDNVGTISITNHNTIHSAIIPVQEGDVLLVKYGQNIDPLDVMARYYYAFGYTDNPLKSCVALADYPNYISAYNDTQYLIHIPKDCGYFYLTMGDVKRADDNVKFCVVKQNLKWLEISQDNMSQEAVSAIISSMISNQSFSTLVANISENAQQTREAEYHLWDSICKTIDFTGKTIKFFGDSITAGTCSPNLGNAGNDRYSSTFCRLVGANESNYAIGGSCITDSQEGDQYNIGTRVKQYVQSTDEIIIIAGGTNDFNTGKTIGSFGDTQRTTFYGSLNDICSYIQTTAPDAVVIFITPIPYTKPESAYPSHIASLNTYRSAIYDVATKYGYNVVDGNSIGMPRMQGGWNNIMCDDSDGCHPTVEGHKLMARNITGKLL